MSADSNRSKVLRIGIIQDGKIVQERFIKAAESVSVGESSKNTFVFPKTHLSTAEHTLFKAIGGGYVLQFTDKMKGKVSSGGAVVALQKLASDPSASKRNGVITLPLTQQDRGKVVIDGVTVLFQFVNPPPVVAVQSIENMDFRPRWIEDDDPVFLGFLALWSTFAMILLFWVWISPKPELQLRDIPDRFAKIQITPKPVEPVEPLEVETDDELVDPNMKKEEKVEPKDQKVEPVPSTEPKPASPSPSPGAPKDVNDAKDQQARKDDVLQKSKLLINLIGQRGESANVVSEIFDGEGATDIDKVLSETSGIATSKKDVGTRDGKAVEGKSAADIGDLKRAGGKGDGGKGTGPAVVAKVEGRVTSGSGGSADLIDGDSAKASSTVKRYASQLQFCYEKELKVNPKLQGRVTMSWSVAGGKTSGIRVDSNSTGSKNLATCVSNKIRRWKFPADAEGSMSWPFLFRPK